MNAFESCLSNAPETTFPEPFLFLFCRGHHAAFPGTGALNEHPPAWMEGFAKCTPTPCGKPLLVLVVSFDALGVRVHVARVVVADQE